MANRLIITLIITCAGLALSLEPEKCEIELKYHGEWLSSLNPAEIIEIHSNYLNVSRTVSTNESSVLAFNNSIEFSLTSPFSVTGDFLVKAINCFDLDGNGMEDFTQVILWYPQSNHHSCIEFRQTYDGLRYAFLEARAVVQLMEDFSETVPATSSETPIFNSTTIHSLGSMNDGFTNYNFTLTNASSSSLSDDEVSAPPEFESSSVGICPYSKNISKSTGQHYYYFEFLLLQKSSNIKDAAIEMKQCLKQIFNFSSIELGRYAYFPSSTGSFTNVQTCARYCGWQKIIYFQVRGNVCYCRPIYILEDMIEDDNLDVKSDNLMDCNQPCSHLLSSSIQKNICGKEETGLWSLYQLTEDVYRRTFSKSIGCYRIHMIQEEMVSPKMTQLSCASFCQMRDFKYAMLSLGSTCGCSNEYDGSEPVMAPPGSADPLKGCVSTCNGDPQQKCGGDGLVKIFDVEKVALEGNYTTANWDPAVMNVQYENKNEVDLSSFSAGETEISDDFSCGNEFAGNSIIVIYLLMLKLMN